MGGLAHLLSCVCIAPSESETDAMQFAPLNLVFVSKSRQNIDVKRHPPVDHLVLRIELSWSVRIHLLRVRLPVRFCFGLLPCGFVLGGRLAVAFGGVTGAEVALVGVTGAAKWLALPNSKSGVAGALDP